MRITVSFLALLCLTSCGPDPQPEPTPAPVDQAEAPAATQPLVPALPREEIACLARAAYHEARGEGKDGMAAVVHVVLNRADSLAYPDTPCAVVEQGNGRSCQFSWFCDGKSDEPRNLIAYERALRVARAAATGELADPTDGATMFHGPQVTPYWTASAELTATVGSHRFYRLD
ncbi:cell wall hydrolase [Parvularcula oceani]|uniref:cell wall hydrolase n=1 Tax=Parvularcula oceani TaxID=1247963 RepID=UPI00068C7280|nr:cell wall hydrolase [Parvularcula oceani]